MNVIQLGTAKDRQEAERLAAVASTDKALCAEIRALRLRGAVLKADLVMLRLRNSATRPAPCGRP